jgi:hypothetical protein
MTVGSTLARAWRAAFGPAPPTDLVLGCAGTHMWPRQGTSLVELVTVYAHEPWSHHPLCVDATLTVVAQRVNDLTTDARRGDLAAFVPWLAGTRTDDPHVPAAVASVCLNQALPVAGEEARDELVAGADIAAGLRVAEPHGWNDNRHVHAQERHLAGPVALAVTAIARAADGAVRRDEVLWQLLADCVDAARAQFGQGPADVSRLDVAPRMMRVRREWVLEDGADWRTVMCLPVDDVEHYRVFGDHRYPGT